MVTLISQNLNEFELHLRAVLGLPIPVIRQLGPAASAVILAQQSATAIYFTGVEAALAVPDVDIKLFGKPDSRPYRRMGVALAMGESIDQARSNASTAAGLVQVNSAG
jgi:phosphoribosylglycinamide formyltransferase 2